MSESKIYDPLNEINIVLDKIRTENPRVNAVTHINEIDAVLAAEQSKLRIGANRPISILDGLLFGVKDNIAVANMPWTAGFAGLKNKIAKRDSEVVRRLRSAGAIPAAMLNMDEGALGAVTRNPYFGSTSNPLNLNYTTGGSSGGSAAAVAAKFFRMALGTDTLGSVRIPAAYCGTFGFKPTPGLISRAGLFYLSKSFDTIGFLSDDLGLITNLFGFLVGPDTVDSDQQLSAKSFKAAIERLSEDEFKKIKIVALPEDFLIGIDTNVMDAYRKTLETLMQKDLNFKRIGLDGWDPSSERKNAFLIVQAEAARHLKGFLQDKDLGKISSQFRYFMDYGASVENSRLKESYKRVKRLTNLVDNFFEECDFLLLPTSPQKAFRHETAPPINQADLTALANICGLPALSLPTGQGEIPSALQIIGKKYHDLKLIDFACKITKMLSF